MSELHVIKDGEYVVKVGGDEDILKPEEGETQVPPRPYVWCDYVGGKWVENAQRKLQIQSAQVRTERDRRLTREVDPIAGNSLRWSSLTRDQQEDWANYRQALLDITSQPGFPHDVTWPNKPPEA